MATSTLLSNIAANPNPRSLRGRFLLLLRQLKTLKRDAVIESGKLIFSIIGLGTVLGNISAAGLLFFFPAVFLFFGAWFAIYLQMEGVKE